MKFTTFSEMNDAQRTQPARSILDEGDKIKELEKSLLALKQRYAELETANDLGGQPLEIDAADMTEEMRNFRSTLNRQTKISKAISDEKENLEKRATEYLKANRHFEDQLEDLKVENRRLNERLEFELTRNRMAISENQDLKTEVQGYETKVIVLEDQLKKCQGELTTAESSYIEKQKILKDIQASIKTINEHNLNVQAQKGDLEAYNRTVAAELKALQEKKAEIDQSVRAKAEQAAQLQARTQQSMVEHDAVLRKFQDSQEAYSLHMENEALLQTEKRNLMEKIQAHCEEEGRLLEDIKELQEKIRHLETENDRIIEQLSRMSGSKL